MKFKMLIELNISVLKMGNSLFVVVVFVLYECKGIFVKFGGCYDFF